MSCSQGALSKLLVEPGAATHTFNDSSEMYDYLYESIAKQGRIVGAQGIAGTRSQYAARTRLGHYMVAGRLAMYTSALDLNNWLPRVLGASEGVGGDADLFDIADSLQPFGIMIDRVGGIFQYNDCYCNRGIWRAKAGPGDGEPELVEQILEVVGKSEDATVSWPSPAPSLSVASTRTPYLIAEGVLTIDSTAYQFKDFVLMVDNHIEPRWVNSITPTALCPQNRTVVLRTTFPFTSSSDAVFSGLYKHASRASGVSATLVFTPTSPAGISTTFTFEGLQWAQQSPVVRGKREINLSIDFICRKTAVDTSEISVTNDPVPT